MNADQIRHQIDLGKSGDDEAGAAGPPSGAKPLPLESDIAGQDRHRRLSTGEWFIAVMGAAAIVCAITLLLPVSG
jgi:di/tricarboxylate transporter